MEIMKIVKNLYFYLYSIDNYTIIIYNYEILY